MVVCGLTYSNWNYDVIKFDPQLPLTGFWSDETCEDDLFTAGLGNGIKK